MGETVANTGTGISPYSARHVQMMVRIKAVILAGSDPISGLADRKFRDVRRGMGKEVGYYTQFR